MLLEKSDLKQIEKIVGGVETRLNKKIDDVETRLSKKIEETVEKSESRITADISREVADLARINRAVIEKVDTINILEKRVTRVEHKVGIIR